MNNSLPLQSITPERIALDNIIVGKRREEYFELAGNKCQFLFSSNPLAEESFFVKIKLSDHIVWLGLRQLPSLNIFSESLKGVSLEDLPEEIKPIVLEVAFKSALEVIEEHLGVVISIEEYGGQTPEAGFDDQLSFKLDCAEEHETVLGSFYMNRAALEFLAALLERANIKYVDRFNKLNVPIRIIIGKEDLPEKEFKSLSERDILLFSEENFYDKNECIVAIGDYLFYKGELKEQTVTLLNAMEDDEEKDFAESAGDFDLNDEEENDEDEMDSEEESDLEHDEIEEDEEVEAEEPEEEEEEEPELDEEEGGVSLDEVPVHLVFEVGRKKIPLDKLRTLREGYTFELSNQASKPVTIRANGQVIGSGELLKVGNRVGVRISKFKQNA